MTIPEVGCEPTIGDGTAFIEAFYIMAAVRKTCSDILFSGHSMYRLTVNSYVP